jgi:hypothetical protein
MTSKHTHEDDCQPSLAMVQRQIDATRRRFMMQAALATLLIAGCGEDGDTAAAQQGASGSAGSAGSAGSGSGAGGTGGNADAGGSGGGAAGTGAAGSSGTGGNADAGGSGGGAAQDASAPEAGMDGAVNETCMAPPAGAYVIAAKDSSAEDKQRADIVCTGTEDEKPIIDQIVKAGSVVFLCAGTYFLSSGKQIRPAKGSTLMGACASKTNLRAEKGSVMFYIGEASNRSATDVTLKNLTCTGYFALYNYCSNFLCENVHILNTLDGKTNKSPDVVAAFQNWSQPNFELDNVTYRNCTSFMSHHHGFACHLSSGTEGGGFNHFTFENCRALHSGDNSHAPQDWSCGFDIPDAGDMRNLVVRGCWAVDPIQDGFHLDGGWDGHRQDTENLVFEDCVAVDCGLRCVSASPEKFQSGFYLQNNVKMSRCIAMNCVHSGFVFKNDGGPNQMSDCVDFGSGYSLDIEFNSQNFQCTNFWSVESKSRALVFTGSKAAFNGFKIYKCKGSGKPVRFGRYERVDFRDCPGHAQKQADTYDKIGYTMTALAMEFLTDPSFANPAALIEIWPISTAELGQVQVKALSASPPSKPSVPADPSV